MSESQNITVSPPSDDRQRDPIAEKELNNSVRQPTPPPPQQEPVSGSVTRPNNAVTEEPQSQATTPPPLPNIFSLPQGGGLNDDLMQAVRNVVTDTFKNITIDGVSPQVSGSNIQFNTQNNQSASSQWSQQNPPPNSNVNQLPQNTSIGGSIMEKPRSMEQAAADRQAQQEADNAKWGWNMTGPRSAKEVAAEKQAQQEAKEQESGWNMAGPTDTKGKIQREEAKEDAARYDIDTRGMSTRQIRKAVAEAKGEDDAEQSEFDSRFERFVSSLKGKSDKEKSGKNDDTKKDEDKGEKERTKAELKNNTAGASAPRYKDTVEVIPVWVSTADKSKNRVAYFVAASNHDIESGSPPEVLTESETGQKFEAEEYYLSGTSDSHPFKVTLISSGESTKYKVGKGSIRKGLNGNSYGITGIDSEKPFTEGFVVATAQVSSDPLSIGNSFSVSVQQQNPEEITIEDGKQTKVTLLIAKLTGQSGGKGDSAPKVWQAITTSYRSIYSFHNGKIVISLAAAPTHPSAI